MDIQVNFGKLMPAVVLILFLQSCSHQKPRLDESFSTCKNVTGKTLSFNSVYTRYPFRVKQTDSTILVLDLHGTDYYCHQFSYPALKFRQSFAKQGNGPGNFLDVENIRIDKQGRIYLLDANRRQMSILNKNNLDTLKRIKLSDRLIRTLDFDIVNDSMFVVPDYTGKHRFSLINWRGEIIRSCFTVPTRNENKNISSIVLAQAWRSFISYNPSNGILAMATQLGQVMEIYDLKNNSIVNILYGKYGEPEFLNKGGYAVPNGIMGYSDVFVGENKIYAVFWGKTFKDIRNDPNSKDGGNMLQVYDLKGKPICQYILDRYVTGFSVDEKRNKIIALDVNNNQPLVEYQL